jgi:hypothetical protein
MMILVNVNLPSSLLGDGLKTTEGTGRQCSGTMRHGGQEPGSGLHVNK